MKRVLINRNHVVGTVEKLESEMQALISTNPKTYSCRKCGEFFYVLHPNEEDVTFRRCDFCEKTVAGKYISVFMRL